MGNSQRKDRGARTSALGLEGLEPRTVLSGMPIGLQFLSVLHRLPGGSQPTPPMSPISDPIGDVEAAGFSIILPSAVQNGLPVRALITAVDATNRPVPFSGDVAFSSSDKAATLPETATFVRGRAIVNVSFATPGEQTLTVSTVGEPPVTGTVTTQVAEPAVATQLALLLPATTRVDSPVRITIMALDAKGRVVPTFTGEATLSTSDEAAALPESVVFERGRATALVTFGTDGEQTLVTKAGDLTAEATTAVAPQPVVADFRIEIRPEVVVGEPTKVSIVAVNAEGQVIRDFSGSATLASSDPTARIPETIQFRRGKAVFQAAFTALGTQQITATSGDVKASATTTVKESPTVAGFSVWMPRNVIAGMPAVAQLMAVDADGRLVRGFTGTLDVSSSDADATLPSTVTFINGIAFLRVTFATVGAQSITVVDPGKPDATGAASTNVMALRFPSRSPLPPVSR